jgi:glycosyltransferase involved in cell wall biosynthesis
MKTSTRMDMHCHSSASRAPVVPWLGAWGVPESYSEPERVYDQARARGMDLVTITDHDTIDGVMSLVDRGFQNVIVGEEVTVHFPEDRCRLHVLVWGLTPALHEDIRTLNLREDVYAFAHWLFTHNLAHSLAHPVYSQNGKLTAWHLERCVLLFKAWESLNGAHAGTHRFAVERYLSRLTPARVQSLQRRHTMRALWMRPWAKAVTGGSDDHALLNIGRTWTEVDFSGATECGGTGPGGTGPGGTGPGGTGPGGTGFQPVLGVAPIGTTGESATPPRTGWKPVPPKAVPFDFLRTVMAGHATVGGETGDSARLAHQVMAVTAQHYAHALSAKGGLKGRAVGAAVARFAGAEVETPSKAAFALDAARSFAHRVRGSIQGGQPRPRGLAPLAPSSFAPLVDELARTLPAVLEKHPSIKASLAPGVCAANPALSRHKEMAAFLDDLTSTLTASCAAGLMQAAQDRDHAAAARSLMIGLLATVAQLPTVYALFHQNKERDLLSRLEHEAAEERAAGHAASNEPANAMHASPLSRPLRVSLFTDTLGDVNGVSRFINNVADRALDTGRDLQVITSTALPVPQRPNIFNFDPVFHTRMPGYATLDIVLPPLLKVLRHLDEHQPDVVHVSTPGPVGLLGLIAAKMLRVPVIGVYHTDFPAYIDRIFDDFTFTSACEWAMRAFYAGFTTIFTRSGDYEKSLVNLGIEPKRIERLMPGLEVSKFNPNFRDAALWRRIESETPAFTGLSRDSVKVLYVGRVSVEKNIQLLARVWKRVHTKCLRAGTPADLVIVGDGPARAELERELKGTHAHFLGFRHGEELSRIYASSHLFAFPSVTDTLGQVVMESQASGLPVIVTDQGGPKEVVKHGVTGYVLTAHDADSEDRWVNSIVALIADRDRRTDMGRAAAESMRGHDIAHSFENFWHAHEEAHREHMKRLGIEQGSRRGRLDHASAAARRTAAPTAAEATAPLFD